MAYKTVQRPAAELSGVVADAMSELQTLRDETQEIVDNATEGLQQTQRIQTLEETASELDRYCDDEPKVPEVIAKSMITYCEAVNKDKRSGPSRAVRRDNACSMLRAAIEFAEAWIEEQGDGDSDKLGDVEQFIEDANEVVEGVEGCEFPGMFG